MIVSLVTCPRCHRPLVVGDEYLGQDYDDDDGPSRDIWSGPVRMWPPPERSLSYSIPEPLRVSFDEARKCFRAQAFTAAAMMCRKTLETLAHLQGAQEANLAVALRGLRDRGVIDGRLHEWADALRITGNDAAHGVDVVISRDDALDALDFTEAIVDYVFVFQARFDVFRRRRQAPDAAG